MQIDVALVPSEARPWRGTVCIVVDELRASSTITTILDGGCSRLYVTSGLAAARRLAGEHDGLLAGERHGSAPRGFDFDNSPAAISRADIAGRAVIHTTSNGTRILGAMRHAPAVLVGCLLNARAAAEAALTLAEAMHARVGVVCAGRLDRFAIDDAVAAGVIVERLIEIAEQRGCEIELTDVARAALRLRGTFEDLGAALGDSVSGRLVTRLGAGEDVAFCAQVDVTRTVGLLRPGPTLTIERLPSEPQALERLAAGIDVSALAEIDAIAARVG